MPSPDIVIAPISISRECDFYVHDHGSCGLLTGIVENEHPRCSKHIHLRCSCGAQATQECATCGQVVCDKSQHLGSGHHAHPSITPLTGKEQPVAEDPKTPEPGDWVQVWAQMTKESQHPDDLLLRLESHNEHYDCYIRKDRVTFDGSVPDFVERCTRLHEVEILNPSRHPSGKEVMLARCIRHHDHGGKHRDASDREWDKTVGYFEEA